MSDDPRIQPLLDSLLTSQATPEYVCASCPELLPQVRKRWREMCYLRDELDAMFPRPCDPDRVPSAESIDGNTLPVIPGYEVEAVLGLGGWGLSSVPDICASTALSLSRWRWLALTRGRTNGNDSSGRLRRSRPCTRPGRGESLARRQPSGRTKHRALASSSRGQPPPNGTHDSHFG